MRKTDRPILVTGGAGFLGSHLVALLVAAGESVVVLERPGAIADHLPARVEVIRADIRDDQAVNVAFRTVSPREVYHLAANPNLWVRDRRDFDAVNHQGTVHVLAAARTVGVEMLIHVSTESILTRADARSPIDENVQVTASDAVGPYCLSKWRAEEAAFAAAGAGQPVLVANPTMPIGPGDRGLSPPARLIQDFLRRKLPAYLDCTLNLVDARDVAVGLHRVRSRGVPGKRHLLGGSNLALWDLLQELSRITGLPAPRFRVPYALALGVAGVQEFWADWVSGAMPQATLTGVRLARRTMHFDPAATWTRLGWTPRPWRESLRDAVDWFRNGDPQETPTPTHTSGHKDGLDDVSAIPDSA